MKRMLMLAAAVLLAATSARAQSEYPRVEIFGGYSYISADTGAGLDEGDQDIIDDREGIHGVGLNAAINLSRHVGIVVDLSYHRKNLGRFGPVVVIPGEPAVEGDFKFNTLFFLFGPQFYVRSDRLTGFMHAMVGVVRAKTEVNFPGLRISESAPAFAMGFGGGVDLNITGYLAARVVQLDYIPVKIGPGWSHNLRAQFGLTLRLGR